MTDSVLSQPPQMKSNRLDPPHDLMLANSEEMATPWMAMAGRDPTAAADQLDRQTSELLAYVQQQNDEIDARQSELNAKLAQLDNELRTARLRSGLDAGADLVPGDLVDQGTALDEMPLTHPTEPPENPETPQPSPDVPDEPTKKASTSTFQEFEEVEKLVANFTKVPADSTPSSQLSEGCEAEEVEVEVDKEDSAPSAVNPVSDRWSDNRPSSVDSVVDIQAMASSLDASELESERRLLAERKLELDQRKSILQRMQDDTQTLHREALEMRLVTEQLWIELSEKAPSEHVNDLLNSLRTQLDDHYTAQQQTIDDRRSELIDLKQLIEVKQEEVRAQSHKLQEWVESRHDELKSRAGEVDARELLLDRREHRMREEFSKWEAQRSSYQHQLHGLLKKLNLTGLGE